MSYLPELAQFSQLLKGTGKNKSELGALLGFSHTTVGKLLDMEHYPGFPLIRAIMIAFPRVNARWLITGEGGMYDSYDASEPEPALLREPAQPYSTHPTVRELQIRVEALSDQITQLRDQLRDKERLIDALNEKK